MSYKVNPQTGEVKNWDEFYVFHYLGDNPTFNGEDYYSSNWDEWLPIEIEGNLEEVREKMLFIYGGHSLKRGDLIKSDLTSRDTYTVHTINDGKIYCQHMRSYKIKIFERDEPYVKMCSLLDLENLSSHLTTVESTCVLKDKI